MCLNPSYLQPTGILLSKGCLAPTDKKQEEGGELGVASLPVFVAGRGVYTDWRLSDRNWSTCTDLIDGKQTKMVKDLDFKTVNSILS